ncbi:uncharacterized protein OGAPODRAFT_11155 [Ogataea polymorpha]|uniref:uncharacterized protein n=1 Tax=Ogataea polymorpha TaxID=460523 RepID=UPI0007F4418A|nr:uncharacterized protein OGAPODRAFT_11155 [Ogataea polymorpha]OBA18623.1 hypothetical protein OGAPODRAFT_11155 [Ogataea polymorpha]
MGAKSEPELSKVSSKNTVANTIDVLDIRELLKPKIWKIKLARIRSPYQDLIVSLKVKIKIYLTLKMIRPRKPVILLASVVCILVVFGIVSSRNEKLKAEIQEEANHLLYQWETLEKTSKFVHKQNYTSEISPEPCTVINPLTNQFFDLRPLGALGNDGLVQAWNARGYDYGRNFSIGICSTPLKQPQSLPESDFEGVTNKSEVGGYYTDTTGHKKSIGQISTTPKFRGRKLVLEYTDGSVCEGFKNDGSLKKSTILSFVCDREIMTKASISYVGSLHDCSYFFEGRQSVSHWKRNSFTAGVKNLAQRELVHNQYRDNVPEFNNFFSSFSGDENELIDALDAQQNEN